MDITHIHSLFLESSGVSTDTRKIDPDSIFFALKGDRFDANTFASQALDKGAKAVIVDNPGYVIDSRTILVKDSLVALQQLARRHREYLKLPILALTGSNGKTTSKELLHAVLSKKFKTGATKGNLNNHIGVPLTLLSFDRSTEFGIVEMGANHQREIAALCEIAQPDYGYITNFGKAHLEGFGGVQGVIKGKSEMYDFLRTAGNEALVNLDDPIQDEKTRDIQRFTFGTTNQADVVIRSITANPYVSVSFDGYTVNSHLIGLYNAANINAAIAAGKRFGVADADIVAALEDFVPENNRSQILKKGDLEIILDAYNANPSSMKVAIENFVQLGGDGKVAFLGDMFELGDESLAEHEKIVDMLADSQVMTYFVGKDFYASRIVKPNFDFFATFEQLESHLKSNPVVAQRVLIKGSRGMALERVVDLLGC